MSTEPTGVDLAIRLLAALRPLAERSDNRTLLALSDLVVQTRNPDDLMSVVRLYTQEFPTDPLAGKIRFPNSSEE
jgi:hypothetical protein